MAEVAREFGVERIYTMCPADDIEPLAGHFLKHYAGRYRKPLTSFDADAISMLRDHRWPGFIRSLEVFTDEHQIQWNVVETERPVAKRFFEWLADSVPGTVAGLTLFAFSEPAPLRAMRDQAEQAEQAERAERAELPYACSPAARPANLSVTQPRPHG